MLEAAFPLAFPADRRMSMLIKVRTEQGQRIAEAERASQIMLSLFSVNCLVLWAVSDIKQRYVVLWGSDFVEIVR